MSKNPRKLRQPNRLIVSVEQSTVDEIDAMMMRRRHHQHRNRAEFVRLAIERELERCESDDFGGP